MSTQLSAPVRIVALVGLLAAVAVGLYTFTAGSSGTGPETASPAALRPVHEANSVAKKLSSHNLATAAGKPDTTTTTTTPAAAKAAAKSAAAKTTGAKPVASASKPVAARAPAAAKPADGTPTTIASLLRTHQVVVVLLYDPQSKVDGYSVAEAEFGAREAGAGFILVDVLNQHAAAPFTKAYGVLQDPSVLFFGRPGKLVQKLTGFADHDTVAQAAANVALGLVGAAQS